MALERLYQVLCANSQLRVHFQHRLHQYYCPPFKLIPIRLAEVDLTLLIDLQQRIICLSLERRLPHQQGIVDYPQRKNITLLSVRLRFKHFRSYISGRPLASLQLLPADHFREPEINQNHLKRLCSLNHNILKF